MNTDPKIQQQHLERRAYVYIRHARPHQAGLNFCPVIQHQLVERAQSLGWAQDQVTAIDDDLDKSATPTADRQGLGTW